MALISLQSPQVVAETSLAHIYTYPIHIMDAAGKGRVEHTVFKIITLFPVLTSAAHTKMNDTDESSMVPVQG